MEESFPPGQPGAGMQAAGQAGSQPAANTGSQPAGQQGSTPAGQAGSQAADTQAAQAQGMAQAQAQGASAAQGAQAQAAGQPGQGQPAQAQLTPEQARDFAPDWKAELPEALRKEAEAFASQEEMKDALRRGAAYRPAIDPADLDVKPEGVEVDPEANRKFRELGVRIGLTREQAAALMEFEARSVSDAVRREQDDGIARLRTQWADKYEARVKDAERALLALDSRMSGRLAAAFGKGGLASSPVLLEAFAHVGSGMAEDSAPAKAAAASARETPLATYERMFH